MPETLEKNKAIMRVHCGTATFQDEKINLSTTLHGAPVISFADGTTVYWTWEELVNKAIELKNS